MCRVGKPLAVSAAEAHELWMAAEQAGVVHVGTFNYRGESAGEQARAMIAAGEIRPALRARRYLQDWLLKPTDFSWRLEPEKGGASSAFADIGSHRRHLRSTSPVSASWPCSPIARPSCPTRQRPATSRAAFADGSAGGRCLPVTSEDLAYHPRALSRGARGERSTSARCAPDTRTICWLEVNGSTTSLRWRQEQQERALDRPARRSQHDAGERSPRCPDAGGPRDTPTCPAATR